METVKRYLTLKTNIIHTLPIVILMPHSRCNCRCLMCDIWQANNKKQELSREQLAHHLVTFRTLNVQWVVLSGGEALMHSNLWTLCALLKELDIRISLLSTGLLLKKHAAAVVEWCDDVVVSLDGSPAVHDTVRNVPRAFERLAEGVAALRQIEPSFRITGRCVLQQQNFRDLPNIITTAQSLGLDQISFLAADVSSTAFNRPNPWPDERVAGVALSCQEVAELAQILERTIEQKAADFSSGFIAENPEKLRRLAHYYAAINGDGEFPETFCNAPWVSAVIEADGTVRPCFFHPKLGNIHEQPFDAVLNSPDAIDFRRELNVKTNETCRKCVCTLSLGARAAIDSC